MMRMTVALVLGAVAVAAADPSPAEQAAENALYTNTLHSGIPGVRFGFMEEGMVAVDTGPMESGGSPYPAEMQKVVVGVAAADPKVVWYAAEVAATTSCPVEAACYAKPDRFLNGTVLVEQTKTGWKAIAWHVAKRITSKQQAAALADDKKLESVPSRIDKGAEAAAKRFTDSLGDPKALAASVSSRTDTMMFGSDKGERWVGGAAVKAQLAKWKLGFKVHDGIQAGVSAKGTVAWVAANVDATPVAKPKAKATPYRVTAIYEQTGADWQLVQLHFSFATDPYARI
jgi:SnoaL-like domain